MGLHLLTRAAPCALALALVVPAAAGAQVSPPAAQEARQQGFDAREALGDDVTLDQTGRDEGLFRVELPEGGSVTTHGPDTTATAGEHGTSLGPGDPERKPVCATTNAQHVLYAAPADQASRYPLVVPEIRAIMRRANAVLNSEAIESGGEGADYRMKCGPEDEIKIDDFTGPAGDDSFEAVVDAAQDAGFDDPGTKYTIFYEAEAMSYCGVGSLYADESLSASNDNNSGTAYAVTLDGCWNGDTPMHENGHNMGAVQPGAPKSTGNGLHCYQERDVMCYSPDGGDRNQSGGRYDCTDHLHFDCGHDDYFDAAPEPGEYLASHWNVGSPLNRFLAFGGGGGGDPPRNDAPVARDDSAATGRSTARDVSVLVNDSDSDGGTLTVTLATDPARGRTAINPGARSVRYTPDPGYVGSDSFTYRISDGQGGQATAVVRLAVGDAVAPTVSMVGPSNGSPSVSPSANATARFSEPMYAATLNTSSFKLVRRGTSTPVRAAVRYSAANRTATLDPSANLARRGAYTAVVNTGAKDAAGNRMRATRTWSFTVR